VLIPHNGAWQQQQRKLETGRGELIPNGAAWQQHQQKLETGNGAKYGAAWQQQQLRLATTSFDTVSAEAARASLPVGTAATWAGMQASLTCVCGRQFANSHSLSKHAAACKVYQRI
jgi:hypothetical protein